MLIVDEESIEKTLKAGMIVKEVLKRVEKSIQPGEKILDLCEMIERQIFDLGGKPAFPCNISINNIAAHYTSPPNDTAIIPEDSVVKVDIGVHIDGYIVDVAKTFSFNPKYDDMVEAVELALENAIKIIKPGIRVKNVSREIERTITGFGYKPISNLTGHMLKKYVLHGGKNIPNVYGEYSWTLEEGEIYAIEPFATDGLGKVNEMQIATIYSLAKLRSGKTKFEKDILKYIYTNFKMLPFCERWILKSELNINPELIRVVINRLIEEETLIKYPVLREVKNGIVTQAETTIIITKNEVIDVMKS